MPARIIYESKQYRVVERDRGSWPKGYYDIEMRGKDAMNEPSWRHWAGIDAKPDRNGSTTDAYECILADILNSLVTGGITC